MAALASLTVWAQLLYFRFFNDLASSAAFLATRQTADLGSSVAALATPKDLWLVIDLLIAIPLLWFGVRSHPARARRLQRLTPVALLLLALPALATGARAVGDGRLQGRRNLQNLRSVSRHGLYGFQVFDAAARAVDGWKQSEASDAELDRVVDWFVETAATRRPAGPMAGIGTGRNLIAIQVESMQGFVLDLEINGQVVTPNLRRMRRRALDFSLVLDQTHRGRSSAGDFVAMTSLLPVGESIAYEYPRNEYFALGHAMSERGYRTLSAIPYKKHFWNRRVTHAAYGFDTNLFRESFERKGPRVGWGINDQDFLRQMLPILKSAQHPFFAWLTTLSLHYPYESFPDELETLELGDLEDTALGNYLHGMNFFDLAFGEFVQQLEMDGLLNQTVIAIWGDHSSGLNRNHEYVEYFDLKTPVEKFLFRRVPFLIWLPGAQSASGRHQMPAGQVDIAPTLLSVMGADPSTGAFLGRNLLGEQPGHRAVHPQGRWMDADLIYLSQFADGSDSCFRTSDLARTQPRLCQAGTERANAELDLVDEILRNDLQAKVSGRLRSLLPPRGAVETVPDEPDLVDVAERP